ncbi:hypothetical protein A2924_01000 [Candidatus Giovannonibacteria bacterium RIFCSPLOWO2_01_FULL_44_16]|uniref:Uncharacterized protein n=1 Tax=Candidatus Giovannonibacteria bacterium RIFCSPLOWO2_01_FULL_44_16 TaxID=1798348 RepID=A0A1F5X3Z1_9BACT|nr:MAG: hypothetical protein A2924_01000 [Candidatus Giovannonibacteria bacterium RIFCSPLOWO2_01_FULL_44_16]
MVTKENMLWPQTLRGALANEHLHWNEFEEKPHFHNWFKCEEYPCRTYCSSATLYKYETHFPTLTKIFTAMGWSLEPLNH